jgi:hypothetical protein
MRFINFIRLELQTKAPVLLDLKYLTGQGFDFTARRLSSTIRQLTESELVTIKTGTELEQDRNSEGTAKEQELKTVEPKGLTTKSGTQKRIDKKRIDKSKRTVKNEPMIPPSLDEIRQYAHKENLEHLDCDYFYKFFTANNWVDSNEKPVKRWKGKAQTWNKMASSQTKTPRNRDANGKPRVAL